MAKAAWTALKILQRTFSQDTTTPASSEAVASPQAAHASYTNGLYSGAY